MSSAADDTPAAPMPKPPRFSVIVPVYNRAALIEATLETVFGQTFEDYELIVVDDGSTDDSVAVLERYGDRLRLLVQDNAGPGPARNHAAREARGDYLAFLDSDDLWFPWTLARYAEALERAAQPAILIGRRQVFEEEATCSTLVDTPLQFRTLPDYLSHPQEQLWWGVSSFVIERERFLGSGGFLEGRMHAEDAELMLRLGTAPGFACIEAPVTFGYRRHDGSVMKQQRRNYEGLAYMIERERGGDFPGGSDRQAARRAVITRHTRPGSLGLLRAGLKAEAWDLYRQTLAWNTAQGRLKYLSAFPLLALRA